MTSNEFHLTSKEFQLTSNEFHLTSKEFRLTSNLFQLTSMEFKLTSMEFKLTSNLFQLTSMEFKLTSIMQRLTSSKFHLTSSKFHLTSSKFHLTSSKFHFPVFLLHLPVILCYLPVILLYFPVFLLAFVLAIILGSVISVNSLTSRTQKKLVVYNINKASAIDIISGNEHILLSDSALIKDTKAVSIHMLGNWLNLHLNDATCIDVKKMSTNAFQFANTFVYAKRNLLQFFDKRMAIVNESNCNEISAYLLAVDYLLVSGNIKSSIADLLDTYKPSMIIFDSSNSQWKTEKWIKECAELNIPCYSVQQSGAFEMSL